MSKIEEKAKTFEELHGKGCIYDCELREKCSPGKPCVSLWVRLEDAQQEIDDCKASWQNLNSLKNKIQVLKAGAVLSETQDYRYGVEQACKEILAMLDEATKQIRENADCYCRHCGQVFDNLQKALKHEKIGVDPHHIHCTVDLSQVLSVLEGNEKETKPQ